MTKPAKPYHCSRQYADKGRPLPERHQVLERYERITDHRTPWAGRLRDHVARLVLFSRDGYLDSDRYRYVLDETGELTRFPKPNTRETHARTRRTQ